MSRDDDAAALQIVADVTRSLTTCASCGERFDFDLMDTRGYDGCCSDECAETLQVRVTLEHGDGAVVLPPVHPNCRCAPGKPTDDDG